MDGLALAMACNAMQVRHIFFTVPGCVGDTRSQRTAGGSRWWEVAVGGVCRGKEEG